MKRIKFNFAIAAMILGTSLAYAAKPAKGAALTYGYDQSTASWTLIRASSHCITNPNQNCEAQFNGDPNNGGTMVPGSLTKGNFVY